MLNDWRTNGLEKDLDEILIGVCFPVEQAVNEENIYV